ncbi:MAG: adenine phosphoribosyltransferase [Euryarchaeota archaeon]|jgi:adenine phosphoribosyltransferase|nr:adenine phosphoribosyltransferase [Euryarchaeota archaeon]
MSGLDDFITTIPDFPKKGIMFRDITSLIQDPKGFHLAVNGLCKMLEDIEFDAVLGSEARGFVFGAPVAYNMCKSLVIVRKKGKLPREVISEEYDLEYGTATLEMHTDSFKRGSKVVIIDDLMATGGTTRAMINMAERLGGEVVKIAFVMELAGLNGRDVLKGYDVESLITYEGN